MPISGPSSYPPTTREFIQHWEQVSLSIGAMLPVLTGNITRTTLEGLLEDLEEARDVVTDALVDRTLARQELNGLIATLQTGMVNFNAWVRANLPGSAMARSLVEAFAIGDGEDRVRQAVRAMARLWAKVDLLDPVPEGVTVPINLIGIGPLANLEALRETLRERYAALTDADVDLRVAREKRNDVQDAIYPILKAYRAKIPTVLLQGNALLDSLPALTPPEGHTPDPVAASGSWNGSTSKADLAWTASEEADLARYEVRGVPGEDYVGEDEVLLETVPAGGTRTFATDFALATPGAVASFKVYVVLGSGRERGSNVVTINRPG